MRQVDISHLLVSSQDLDQTEDVSLCGAFFFAGISSTADVQGRALCPGSTPGAPLYISTQKNLKIIRITGYTGENV